MRRTAWLAAGLAAAAATDRAYAWALRPWHLRWGATDEEVSRAMPGDDQVDRPVLVSTRAVTVDAEPAAIWPWLAQMGAGRGGLYSYDSSIASSASSTRPAPGRSCPSGRACTPATPSPSAADRAGR